MSVSYLSYIRESRGSSIAVSIIAAAAIAMLAVSPASAATACGPFGDTPQTLISNPIPNCLGGKRLGPWNDSDGRRGTHACTYQRQRPHRARCRCSSGCIRRW